MTTTRLKRPLARRRWRPCDAEAVLHVFEVSGLTLPVFAREHGLHLQRLRRWQRRLQRRTGADSVAGTAARPAESPLSLVPVRVRVQTGPTEPARLPVVAPAAPALDVSVGAGVVHVPVGFDADHLRRVVAALAASC